MSKSRLIKGRITNIEQIIKEFYIGDYFTSNTVSKLYYIIMLDNNDKYIVNTRLDNNHIGKEICLYKRHIDDDDDAAVVSNDNIKIIKNYEKSGTFIAKIFTVIFTFILSILAFVLCDKFLNGEIMDFYDYCAFALIFVIPIITVAGYKTEKKKSLNEEELALLQNMAELNAFIFKDEASDKDVSIKKEFFMPETHKL